MHPYGDPALAAQPLGEADVIGVRVREHERADILDRQPHRRELGRQVIPVAGGAGVDDRHLAGLFEQVHVHQTWAETADARRDLH